MTGSHRKKLIEVALPLEDINREAAREKSIRHGHPSTLHLWWARRPLAACRAVLFSSLVDDPSECVAELMADTAKRDAAEGELRKRQKLWKDACALLEKARTAGISAPDPGPPPKLESIIVETERERLFDIIRDLVKWENSNDDRVINAARAEIMRSCNGKPPPVYDPFCGGGSIPLEAKRLGLEAHGSDLNPVPVLITKALIEIPPKFAGRPPINPKSKIEYAENKVWHGAEGLAEDIRYYGQWMRDEAEKRIGHLYPKVKLPKEHGGGEATVIAWLWTRTVASPNPAAKGAHVPLVRSFWLSNKPGQEAYVAVIIAESGVNYCFEVRTKTGAPVAGTVGRNGATCLLTGSPIPLDYVRAEGRGGRMGVRLMAIVAEGSGGRIFLQPNDEQERIAGLGKPSYVPDSDLPDQALGFRIQAYGMVKHRHLFSHRQLVALTKLSDLVQEARNKVLLDSDGNAARADAVATYLAFALDKVAEGSTTLCTWSPLPTKLHVVSTFGRQALPMVWDFAEANVFADSSGNIARMVELVADVIERQCTAGKMPATAEQNDASKSMACQQVLISTDPPYYDNIGYADLSDFFYVWLRRSLGSVHPSLFGTVLVPKASELIASPFRFGGDKAKAEEHFLSGLEQAFRLIREALVDGFPLSVFYAFKQAEEDAPEDEARSAIASTGWETMLAGMLVAGFEVLGTWPMRTERAGGFRNKNQNALASSIVLVCRPRPKGAGVASRRDFLAALKRELPEALRNLQKGNIAPVDFAQAAIGPGMAVFSRYAKVLETDGTPMSVRTALSLINQSLDEVLAEQEGEFDSDTRWALAWFDQNGFSEGPYGMAETLCTAKNTSVAGMVDAGFLAAKSGKVRLLRRDELPSNWDPVKDTRLTIWECTHQLIRALDAGEEKAADLLKKVGSHAEAARDLSYRLYSICERRKWAQDALGYNALVLAWGDVRRLAGEAPAAPRQVDGELNLGA